LICGRDSSEFGKPFFFLLRHSSHIATIDISRSDVTPDLSSAFQTVTSPFPSHTPHVPAKPKTLSRQKVVIDKYGWDGGGGVGTHSSFKEKFKNFLVAHGQAFHT
jgi:hypothetical protein